MNSSECWYTHVCENIHEGCEKTCPKFLEMKYLMDNSNIPKNKQKPLMLTPEDCDYEAFTQLADIKNNIYEFVSEGKNLYITSSHVGNGKTSWALKLLMKYFETVWMGNGFRPRGVIVHVPTFLLKCKDFNDIDEHFIEMKRMLTDIDLVIWDDIIGNSLTGYDYSQLLMYLDARDFKGLSNIFTGNITSRDTIEDAVGAKLTSRIWNNSTTVIEFKGGDRR